jgi:hypothetical protein
MPWTWCHCGMRVRREARRHTPSRRASHSSDTPFVVRGTDADGGSRTLMAQWPPVSETGAYSDSATSARRAAGRDADGRLVVSSGRPRGLPLRSRGLEARLSAGLEHHDLGRAVRLLRTCRDPDEVQVHLVSSLCMEQACQGSNPDQRGWSSPCFRLHHRPSKADGPNRTGLSEVALRCSSD